MRMILKLEPKVIVDTCIDDHNRFYGLDDMRARTYLVNKQLFKDLTKKWYKELDSHNIKEAYNVYNHPYYWVDTLDCFLTYSRKYLKDLQKQDIKGIKSVIDLGNGLGYSTAVLKQLYPQAKVWATNLKNTRQWRYCIKMSHDYAFGMTEDLPQEHIDLVFASEYFEHRFDALDHLGEVLDKLSPNYLVIANSFNTESIGHFRQYKEGFHLIDESKISRKFNKILVDSGYKKLKTKIWNNKPTIWTRL
jgi:hypothetical protein